MWKYFSSKIACTHVAIHTIVVAFTTDTGIVAAIQQLKDRHSRHKQAHHKGPRIFEKDLRIHCNACSRYYFEVVVSGATTVGNAKIVNDDLNFTRVLSFLQVREGSLYRMLNNVKVKQFERWIRRLPSRCWYHFDHWYNRPRPQTRRRLPQTGRV
jgi:hypothetical protein